MPPFNNLLLVIWRLSFDRELSLNEFHAMVSSYKLTFSYRFGSLWSTGRYHNRYNWNYHWLMGQSFHQLVFY